MTKFIKIIATIVFVLIWGQLQQGCREGAKASGSNLAYNLMNMFGLVLVIAGVYGIWKYNPNKNKEDEDEKLDRN